MPSRAGESYASTAVTLSGPPFAFARSTKLWVPASSPSSFPTTPALPPYPSTPLAMRLAQTVQAAAAQVRVER